MTTAAQSHRSLSPVQEILARDLDRKHAPSEPPPDAWLRLHVAESGLWSATLFGPALDRSATEALTLTLGKSVRLLAQTAAQARRSLVVHTVDEHGVRYVDVLDPPPRDVHQVPPSAVDAAANVDAIHAGLPSAVWSADRTAWTPAALPGRRPRARTPIARKAVVAASGAATGLAIAGLLLIATSDRTTSGDVEPSPASSTCGPVSSRADGPSHG